MTRTYLVDVDMVLADLIGAVQDFLRQFYDYELPFERITSPGLECLCPGNQEALLDLVGLLKSPGFYERLEPLLGAVEGFRALVGRGRVYVATARPDSCLTSTVEWLEAWGFKGSAGILAEPEKARLVERWGITHAVEDNPDQARGLARAGAQVYVLAYPWNTAIINQPGLTRVANWTALLQADRSDPVEAKIEHRAEALPASPVRSREA